MFCSHPSQAAFQEGQAGGRHGETSQGAIPAVEFRDRACRCRPRDSRSVQDFAKQLHPARKIDAHGTMGEPSACGDFGSGHALDETKDKGLAIGVGEGADGSENGLGFSGGVRSLWCR
jgi:hypothetical protein